MSILFSDTGTTFSGETLMGFLLALVVLCLAFIIVLTVIVVRQRRQIARKNECIVRNASLYLGLIHKKDVPELSGRRPESELSQVELVSLMQLIRKMLYGFALILPAAPVMAQDNTDTTYVFRFVPTDDMFYEALGDNRTELERLEDAVEKYYDDILEGNIPIRVDGYCNSGGNRKTNLKLAKDRSNRVKSELITFSRIVEGNFITKNHSGEGDYVLVRLVVPKRLSSPSSSENDDKSISDNNMNVTDNAPNNQEKEKPAEEPQAQPVQAEQPQADETAQVTPVEKEGKADAYRFSLRANLPTFCVGPHSRPTLASSGASTACGASSYTARGLRGRGTTRTEGMPCGKYRPKCVAIWARNGAATSARCIRQAHSTTSCLPRAVRAT